MLDQIPQEILEQVLFSLERQDLQALRLVCKTLSRTVVPVLFRTIHISCLILDRLLNIAHHPKISEAVEELQYQEMSFDLVTDDETTWKKGRMEDLASTITEFNLRSKRLEAESFLGVQDIGPDRVKWLAKDWDVGILWEHDAEMKDPSPGLSMAKILAMIESVMELYATKAGSQKPQHLYEVFRNAFPHLRKLRRIVCVEADAGGIALEYPRLECEEAFQQIRDVFPLTDSTLRTCLQPDEGPWPSHGFMGIWRALSERDSSSDIQHFEIRRNNDLFSKRGIHLGTLELQDGGLVHGFRNLTALSLCLEVNIRSPWCSTPQTTLLLGALTRAVKLRRLEICLTSCGYTQPIPRTTNFPASYLGVPFGHSKLPFKNIIPFVSFPELDTVMFEEIDFTTEEICSWLFIQPKLRNLSLRRPYLRGRWTDVIQTLSEKPEFGLDSLKLENPWDDEKRDRDEGATDALAVKMPSAVSDEAILDFINGGRSNPFEGCCWDSFDWPCPEGDWDIYSDVSDWQPGDQLWPDGELDPAEFDEDYDFDAEEDSDVEMEEADMD